MLRYRRARPHLAALAAITLMLGAAEALAQAAPGNPAPWLAEDSSVVRPEGEFDGSDSSRAEKTPRAYGNPPGFGAGRTGFVSSKVGRKLQSKTAKRLLPAVVTARAQRIAPFPELPGVSTGPTTTLTPPLPRRQFAPKLDPYEPLGVRLRSFLVKPAVEISGGYDTNPLRATKPTGSPLFIVAPELLIHSDWSRHELRADLRGSYTAYPSLSSLDHPYFSSKIDGRVDVTRQTRIDLQHRFVVSTENPGSPDFQEDAAEPTTYTSVGGTAGLAHRFNRLEVGGKIGADRTRYQDTRLNDGTIESNEDRNFAQYGFGLFANYELNPAFKPYVQVETDRRVHDLAVDRSGIERDSRGVLPKIGTTFELTHLLTGDVSLGYLTRSYEDPSLQELKGLIADVALIWSATRLTTVTLAAKSSALESTDPEISGVLARDFGVQIDHSLRRWLLATLKFGVGLDDYVGSPRRDHRFLASAALTYKMSRTMQLKGEVRRESRSSNQPDEDYTANIFLLGLRLQR